MRIFNLSQSPLDYRGRTIPPNGGFIDPPNVEFLPQRDQALASAGVLAFGTLPIGWEPKVGAPPVEPVRVRTRDLPMADEAPVVSANVEVTPTSKRLK